MSNEKSIKPSLINRLLAGLFFGLGVSLSIGTVSFLVYLVLAVPPGTTNPVGPPPGNDVSWAPLYVDPVSQRVGINDSTPSHTLTVVGKIKATSDIVTDAGGSVGIGTTSPVAKLHVRGGAGEYPQIYLTSDNGAWNSYIAHVNNGTVFRSASVADIIYFNNNNGNIGIGTTNPTWKFQINGAGSGGLFLVNGDGTGTTNRIAQIGNGVGKEFVVLANGQVGIGTINPAPGDKLDVAGDIRTGDLANGALGCIRRRDGAALVGACSSDKRLKKNITPLTQALEKVTALQPVNFEWRVEDYPDRQFGAGKMFGLIADDVEKVLPELVATDKEGYKTVSYGPELQMLLIEAIKEQQKEIDTLKQEISILKARY